MAQKFTKEFIRERLEHNQVDLAMCQLTTVPVRELAAFAQITIVDLSCNLLTQLPDNFCTLRQLAQLDLGKNKLTSLPDAFGNLSQLQKLDLYGNQLTTLPVTFSQLKQLKWLDVKHNPLEEEILEAAGSCADDRECRQCAKEVIALMKQRSSDIERRRQERLRAEQEQRVAVRAEEERKQEEMKLRKAQEKQKRREQYMAQQAAKEATQLTRRPQKEGTNKQVKEVEEKPDVKQRTGISTSCALLIALVFIVALIVGLFIYCQDGSNCRGLSRNVMALFHKN
ncbi:leucine-rich repeat-containing protein 59-like [Corticium candelabrum]|uniref:leucine-rich repeat-containing protein 59-like n=1 Tax=Corticium candelabrum TaxID=121492 RepID=UPI002E263D39|nr:leucine-rich repeat-containing protein 59-like [Corticium candelabrum]